MMTAEEIDPIEDRYSAIHEAGHAVAAVLLDMGLRQVHVGVKKLLNGKLIGGKFEWRGVVLPALAGKGDEVVPLIAMYLAGPLAEKKINPKAINPKALGDDFTQALAIAEYAAGEITDLGKGEFRLTFRDDYRWTIYEKGRLAALALVNEHWATIETIAELLQSRRSMTGEEVGEIVRITTDTDTEKGSADRLEVAGQSDDDPGRRGGGCQ